MKNIMQTKKFHKLNDKKENEKLIKTSDLLLNNTFIFDKVWDMERCLIPINLGDDIDWNFVGNDDEEWTFMLNRMGYLDTLILSFIYTKEEKYTLKAKYFILDWIKKHEEIKYSYSTRTLDTGIRVLNIYECACYLSKYNFIGEKEIQTIIDSSIEDVLAIFIATCVAKAAAYKLTKLFKIKIDIKSLSFFCLINLSSLDQNLFCLINDSILC